VTILPWLFYISRATQILGLYRDLKRFLKGYDLDLFFKHAFRMPGTTVISCSPPGSQPIAFRVWELSDFLNDFDSRKVSNRKEILMELYETNRTKQKVILMITLCQSLKNLLKHWKNLLYPKDSWTRIQVFVA